MGKLSLKRAAEKKHPSEPDVDLPSTVPDSVRLYPKSERKSITDRPWRLECERKNSHIYSQALDKFYYRTKLMARYMAWYKHQFHYPSYDSITLIHQPSQGMLK